MKKIALFLLAAIALASCDNNQTGPDYPNISFVLQRESVESFSIIKGTNTINTLEDLNPYENQFTASVNLDWKPDDIRIIRLIVKKQTMNCSP